MYDTRVGKIEARNAANFVPIAGIEYQKREKKHYTPCHHNQREIKMLVFK